MAATLLRLDSQHSTRVEEPDLEELCRFQWFCLNGYAARQQRTRTGTTIVLMHRQLMRARPGELVDHEDGDRLNNCRTNLRVATPSENGANRAGPRANAYRGVYYEARSGRYRAQIKCDGRNRYLGTHDTPEAAAEAYDRAARARWGRFARLNFPGLASEIYEQLSLFDPFDIPVPASRTDWFEISYYLRANRWQPHAGTAHYHAEPLHAWDIPF